MNWKNILMEMGLAAFNSQVAKAATWVEKHVGSPHGHLEQAAIQMAKAGLAVGAAAVAAKPDHADLRGPAHDALETIAAALNSTTGAGEAPVAGP